MIRGALTATQIAAELTIPAPAERTAPSHEELDLFLAATYRPDADGMGALQHDIYKFRHQSGRASASIKYAGASALALAAVRSALASIIDSASFNTYSNYVEVGVSVAIVILGVIAKNIKDAADVAESRLRAAQVRASAVGFFRVAPGVVEPAVDDMEAPLPAPEAAGLRHHSH